MKEVSLKKKGLLQLEILALWCQKSEGIQVYFVFGLVGPSSAFNLEVWWLS